MKIKYAFWFWVGIFVTITAVDGISYRIEGELRFPEPIAAIPLWMVVASIPALIFYASGKIISGKYPETEERKNHFLYFVAGVAYCALVFMIGTLISESLSFIILIPELLLPPLFWVALRNKKQKANQAG